MRDPDLLRFQAVVMSLSSFQHTMVERRSQTPKPITMMRKMTIGELSEHYWYRMMSSAGKMDMEWQSDSFWSG